MNMKKITAILLILAMMSGCSVTGCTNRNTDIEEESESTYVRPTRNADDPPLFQTGDVDVTEEFTPVTVESVDTPWVIENSIPFSNASVIYTHFYELVTDPGLTRELDVEILNDTATIQRPVVRHYPDTNRPGYTIYEITYTEYFPIRSEVPDQEYSYSWAYHAVQFIDYYTGTTYPEVNFSSDISSFCVFGDVTYEDQTYTVYYYSYRECVTESDEVVTDEDGRQIDEINVSVYYTTYFVVPDGYDGIVMCIYTSDSEVTLEDAIEFNRADLLEPHIFGEDGSDESIEDFTFLNIAELG